MKKKSKITMRRSISLPADLDQDFHDLLLKHDFRNRSEAIRDFIRAALVEEEWKNARGEVIGVLTLVYDHHARALKESFTALQHQFLKQIVTSLHVHLNADNCLEVVILRGSVPEIDKIAHQLIATKGVKHGKFVASTTAEELS